MVDKKVIIPLLIEHENLVLKPYTDTVGKLTIGIGRNLTDRGITKVEAIYLCSNNVDESIAELKTNLYYWDNLPDKVQLVLVDMIFNLGWPRLSQFKKSLALIEKGDYFLAGDEILNSTWATQVGKRAMDLSEMLKSV